ncbi:MAG TPA: hypothetical protein VNA20_11325 [Frankiaceae bacterium]|nr:hypothetical protein [Frankiaceae bacterium]
MATDKPEYAIGEIARVTCVADFTDPQGGWPPDIWALVTVELEDDRGQFGSPQVYPDFPLHDRDADNEQVVSGWTAVPIQSGRWGRFRVTAVFYEPERHEIGADSVEFVVQPIP